MGQQHTGGNAGVRFGSSSRWDPDGSSHPTSVGEVVGRLCAAPCIRFAALSASDEFEVTENLSEVLIAD